MCTHSIFKEIELTSFGFISDEQDHQNCELTFNYYLPGSDKLFAVVFDVLIVPYVYIMSLTIENSFF